MFNNIYSCGGAVAKRSNLFGNIGERVGGHLENYWEWQSARTHLHVCLQPHQCYNVVRFSWNAGTREKACDEFNSDLLY